MAFAVFLLRDLLKRAPTLLGGPKPAHSVVLNQPQGNEVRQPSLRVARGALRPRGNLRGVQGHTTAALVVNQRKDAENLCILRGIARSASCH